MIPSNLIRVNEFPAPAIGSPSEVVADEYAAYWLLTDYQRHCLIATNYWLQREGKEVIHIPAGELAKIKEGYYADPVRFAPLVDFQDVSTESSQIPATPPQPRFSLFNPPITNTFPARAITLAECARFIRTDEAFRKNTEKLRAFTVPEDRKRFKSQSLAYVCFSGIFSRRTEASLITHSGLIVIDLDHIAEPSKVKDDLSFDWELNPAMIYISPSGDGLKVIIPIDIVNGTHADYFDAISNYLLHSHGLKADPSGRDVSRACFLCHDPKIFLHPSYNDWY